MKKKLTCLPICSLLECKFLLGGSPIGSRRFLVVIPKKVEDLVNIFFCFAREVGQTLPPLLPHHSDELLFKEDVVLISFDIKIVFLLFVGLYISVLYANWKTFFSKCFFTSRHILIWFFLQIAYIFWWILLKIVSQISKLHFSVGTVYKIFWQRTKSVSPWQHLRITRQIRGVFRGGGLFP